MEPSNMISTAIKLHHVTNLNTYVLDKHGAFIYHHESITIPAFMPGSGDDDVMYLHQNMEMPSQLYTYVNEWGLHYLGYFISDGEEGYNIIVGPYFEVVPDLFALAIDYNLSSKESDDLRAISDNIQVLTAEQSGSYATVLQQFKSMTESETATVVISADKNESSEDKNMTDNETVDNEAEVVKLRYKIEDDFMHAVEQGDKRSALKLINSKNMLFSFSERFPNQPLHRLKNIDVVLNTLLRKAAGAGGVPALIIHRISEKYAYKIGNANQMAALTQLKDQMIEEYCDTVQSYSLGNYSKMTQDVIEYLISYFDKQINKDDLAAHLSTHPSHMSRKFKQETNLTITAYQQSIRIRRAKHLLRTERLAIEEIAWMIGYEDSSYFGRVFKKETGWTPSQYREG